MVEVPYRRNERRKGGLAMELIALMIAAAGILLVMSGRLGQETR